VPPATYEEACAIIVDQQRLIADLRRRLDWADERPGGGPKTIAGFTATETRVLRKIAGFGFISYEMFEALQRHMSNIRKKLPAAIRIKTNIGEGYEVAAGIELLRDLVAGKITIKIETVRETKPAKASSKPTGRRRLPPNIVHIIEERVA